MSSDDISVEAGLLKDRYSRRQNTGIYDVFGKYFYYNFMIVHERSLKYALIIRKKFGSANNLKIIEIGAGSGSNLLFFKRLGINWKDIYANEMLQERVVVLRENLPVSVIHPGNVLDLHYKDYFDIVFQSTVFTSVLNLQVKQKMADKLVEMTKSGGIILWYDFKFNNPANKDVKGIKKDEIIKLFPGAKIDFYSVTLAPPIGRRIGKLYSIVNFFFPFLRSHIIAVIHK